MAIVAILIILALIFLGFYLASQKAVKQAEAYFPPIGEFVTVEGTPLHYLLRGKGKPVVLIHGNPGFIQDFSLFPVEPLVEEYLFCIIERPGHGYSERPQKSEVSPVVQARLLHGALEKLGIEQPIVVGYSWGGVVTLAYALEYADDLAAIVLLAPLAFQRTPGNPLVEMIAKIPVVGDLLRTILPVVLGQQLVEQNLEQAFSPEPVPANYLEIAQALWTRPSQTKAVTLDNLTINPSLKALSPRYKEINKPTIIVVGDSDRVVNPEENSIALSQAIASSTLIRLPNTNHIIPQISPEAVLDAIRLASEQASPS